ncbi:hypothetical protein ACWGB8_10290 [Kitasatospora sp. NPDC054939]
MGDVVRPADDDHRAVRLRADRHGHRVDAQDLLQQARSAQAEDDEQSVLEGGDHDGAPTGEGAFQCPGEPRVRRGLVVVPAAVGGLHQQDIGAGERVRRAQQRMDGSAEVAARGEGVAVLQGQVDPHGAEYVPGAVQPEPDSRRDLRVAAQGDRVEHAQGVLDVLVVVEQFRRAGALDHP